MTKNELKTIFQQVGLELKDEMTKPQMKKYFEQFVGEDGKITNENLFISGIVFSYELNQKFLFKVFSKVFCNME